MKLDYGPWFNKTIIVWLVLSTMLIGIVKITKYGQQSDPVAIFDKQLEDILKDRKEIDMVTNNGKDETKLYYFAAGTLSGDNGEYYGLYLRNEDINLLKIKICYAKSKGWEPIRDISEIYNEELWTCELEYKGKLSPTPTPEPTLTPTPNIELKAFQTATVNMNCQ